MKKLLFVLGSRGEWGYIKPIIEISQDYGFVSEVCATNMMLLPKHGDLLKEIISEGVCVSSKIMSAVSGDSREAMAKSIGLVTQSFADILFSNPPNWVILAGDRAEQFGAAIASTFMYIPTAHIQAGERSGNIDGVTRHAITKLTHLHFASNSDATERLIRMGEQKFRVIETGAPQIDSMLSAERPTKSQLIKDNYIPNSEYALVCFHPVTEDYEDLNRQVEFIVNIANSTPLPKVWILPNNDAGGELVRDAILNNKNISDRAFSNIKRETYLSIMEHASIMFGNSSSGILEAPTFRIPVVNIGHRQANRISAKNVIHVDFDKESCEKAILNALSSEFKESIKRITNPYGDGSASHKILKALQEIVVTRELLVKSVAY
jgi:GDP/UDP-N,N'-diacetylbacillosamine 2-epimerase (hydrolysing)